MSSQQRNLKLTAAVIGASVLVTMGAMTLTGVGHDINVTQPEPTLGETSTESTAPPEPETSVASPTATATTSEGEWAPPGPPEG